MRGLRYCKARAERLAEKSLHLGVCDERRSLLYECLCIDCIIILQVQHGYFDVLL